MLMDTIFEKINDNYSYGQYAEFKVIIMTKNGYINATKLCTQHGKLFKNWLRNGGSKELINEVNSQIAAAHNRAADADVFMELKGGDSLTRGTYVHPLLVPHIASWVSPKFAIKVSKIVNDFIVSEYKHRNDLLSKRVDDLLQQMTEQSKQMAEQSKQMAEQTKETIKIREKADTIITQNVSLNTKVDALQGTINRIETKLKNNGSNVPADNALKESIIIMQKNDIVTFIRAQNRSVKQSMRNKKSQGFGLVDGVSDVASTVGTFNVVKSQLLSDGHICKVDSRMYNDVKLVDITTLDLVRIITVVNNNCKTLEEESIN
jgi:hypothetical protein